MNFTNSQSRLIAHLLMYYFNEISAYFSVSKYNHFASYKAGNVGLNLRGRLLSGSKQGLILFKNISSALRF